MKLDIKISNDDCLELVEFAKKEQKNLDYFIPNGDSRQYCILNHCKNEKIKDLSLRLWKEKYQEIGIFEFEEEPIFGVFLGVNNTDGFVHEHTDRSKDGFNHVRINFLLSKAIQGGVPIIDGKELQIEERESWLNIADVWKHKSSPVIGNKDRIVLSLGALVSKNIMYNFLSHKGEKL